MSNIADDQTCSALASLDGLRRDRLHRFIVGRDQSPTTISPEDLGDPFAQLVLRQSPHPTNSDQVIRQLQAAVGEGDPRGVERAFVVGEGSQLSTAGPRIQRALRFVVTLGIGDVDVILSTASPDSDSVEVMAWDSAAGGFNYYRTTANGGPWVFGGNSADAIRPDTTGKGPFESHTGGNLLMKELRFPWVHWHSTVPGAVAISQEVLEGSVDGHRWGRVVGDGDGTLDGADVLETQVAMPSIDRWTTARFEAIRSGREPARLKQLFRHVVTTPTVNLVSSNTRSSAAAEGAPVDLPPQFFVDSETFTGRDSLGLASPPALVIPADIYRDILAEFDVRLANNGTVVQTGDTFFAFVIPERAFEDIAVTKALREVVVTERLLAALLLVDFANPVFSPVRERLLQAFSDQDGLPSDPAVFSEAVAEQLRGELDETTRSDFFSIWDAGEAWRDAANQTLTTYYSLLTQRLAEEPAVVCREWFRLAESRRRLVRQMKIFESPLLLATSNAAEENLRMRPDAVVVSA